MDFAEALTNLTNAAAVGGLIVAGVAALAMALLRSRRSDAMPPLLALIAGAGFIALAMDATFRWHQAAGDWLDTHGFAPPPGVNNIDDVIMMAYVAIAGLVLGASLPVIARSPRFLVAILVAGAMLAVAEALDAFASPGTWQQSAEEPLEAMGALILAVAFAFEARRNEPRPLVGMRLEQPRMRSHATIPR